MKRVILTIVIAVAFSAFAAADSVTFILDPSSGSVSGNPGSVVGWGFAITNSTADWLVLTGSTFDPTAGSDPGVGDGTNYTDFLSSQFYVVDPSSTLSAAFDPNSMSGVGEFDINPTAEPDTNAHGNIALTYDEYSQDPNSIGFDPGSIVLSDQMASAPAMVTVPEPSSLDVLDGRPAIAIYIPKLAPVHGGKATLKRLRLIG